MTEQLELNLPGVTVTWADLRPGDRIRWFTPDGAPQPRTWRVDTMPEPSMWAQPGHAAHCSACRRPRPIPTGFDWERPPDDCDRRPTPQHVSVSLTDLSVDHIHGRGTNQVATDPVERIAKGTSADWARYQEQQEYNRLFDEQRDRWAADRAARRAAEAAAGEYAS